MNRDEILQEFTNAKLMGQALAANENQLKAIEARNLTAAIERLTAERMTYINQHVDKLIEAWIAETGLKPSESLLVQQNHSDGRTTFHVERKRETVTVGAAPPSHDNRCEQCARPSDDGHHYAIQIRGEWYWGCATVDVVDGIELETSVRIGNRVPYDDIRPREAD